MEQVADFHGRPFGDLSPLVQPMESEPFVGYLYDIVNDLDPLVYVGITDDPDGRWRVHKSHGQSPKTTGLTLYDNMKRDGVAHYRMVIVATFTDPIVLGNAESARILELKTQDPLIGHNITGGRNGLVSEEGRRRKKLGAQKRWANATAETRTKHGESGRAWRKSLTEAERQVIARNAAAATTAKSLKRYTEHPELLTPRTASMLKRWEKKFPELWAGASAVLKDWLQGHPDGKQTEAERVEMLQKRSDWPGVALRKRQRWEKWVKGHPVEAAAAGVESLKELKEWRKEHAELSKDIRTSEGGVLGRKQSLERRQETGLRVQAEWAVPGEKERRVAAIKLGFARPGVRERMRAAQLARVKRTVERSPKEPRVYKHSMERRRADSEQKLAWWAIPENKAKRVAQNAVAREKRRLAEGGPIQKQRAASTPESRAILNKKARDRRAVETEAVKERRRTRRRKSRDGGEAE